MNTFARSFIASLALGLLGWIVTPVQAQTPNTPALSQKPAEWTQQFEKQMVYLLSMPDPNRQERAMQLVIHYAQFEDESGQPVFGFKRAVPRLLDIYKHDADRGKRLLALAALSAIDDPSAMQALAATVRDESSEMVRKRAMHVLSAHLQQ